VLTVDGDPTLGIRPMDNVAARSSSGPGRENSRFSIWRENVENGQKIGRLLVESLTLGCGPALQTREIMARIRS